MLFFSRSIDCMHFDFGEGSCPFGTSCFYKASSLSYNSRVKWSIFFKLWSYLHLFSLNLNFCTDNLFILISVLQNFTKIRIAKLPWWLLFFVNLANVFYCTIFFLPYNSHQALPFCENWEIVLVKNHILCWLVFIKMKITHTHIYSI